MRTASSPSSSPVVHLEIRDQVLGRAARAVLDECGWRQVENGGDDALVVADRSGVGRRVDVLLVPSTAAGCTDGIAMVARGDIRCALSIDDLDVLGRALEIVADGWVGWRVRVADTASPMPALSVRQREVLIGVIEGKSNVCIARALFVSEATVKRDVSELTEVFGAASRTALAAVARDFGVHA